VGNVVRAETELCASLVKTGTKCSRGEGEKLPARAGCGEEGTKQLLYGWVSDSDVFIWSCFGMAKAESHGGAAGSTAGIANVRDVLVHETDELTNAKQTMKSKDCANGG
jgi:hypothetical protein